MSAVELFPIEGIPLIKPGDPLAAIIVKQLEHMNKRLQPDDVVVIAQKVVSKVEGRLVALASVDPSDEAKALAEVVDKDSRIVQVILDDSRAIIRSRRGLLVAEQQAGWICANAGVDRSNVQQGDDGEEYLALLPVDGDASAERIREELRVASGVAPAVIINDSHGRPWRVGTVGVCIGCAGLAPIWNQRGLHDLFGYELHSSEECIADELAAAASLLMGQSNEGQPVVIISGYQRPAHLPPAPSRSIQRTAATDAFR
ncbi:MAG TPA: coenzyme F420-0:L-glutamate ligase [Caldilineaceae bacterium]|nr:coenzyme F420-0:L-glutamate ligase [Caldilineaceae bacterium]